MIPLLSVEDNKGIHQDMMKKLSILLCILLGWVTMVNAQTPDWDFDLNAYQYSMSLTAFIAVDDVVLANENDLVGVFDGDECRGFTQLIYIESTDRYLAYLQFYSNTNGEELNFKIYNSEKDEVVDVSQTITFAIDEHYGNVFQAYSIAEPSLNTAATFIINGFEEVEILNSSTSNDTLYYQVEYGTDLRKLTPDVEISEGASLYNGRTPLTLFDTNEEVDFSNPINIDVMSEDQSTIQSYVIKVELKNRELEEAPVWSVDPTIYTYSMNIIGKIKISGDFSSDLYTKVGAFVNGEERGEAVLEYDDAYDDYFIYLSIYSNTISGEEIEFKIWDAFAGKSLHAVIDEQESIEFISDQLLGNLAEPVVFENTDIVQQIISLNSGWTWLSLFIDKDDYYDVNALTENLELSDLDRIYDQYNFDMYDERIGWTGSLSASGGVDPTKMYKTKLAQENFLSLEGQVVDTDDLVISLHEGWNWLSYPISKTMSVTEALENLDAQDGDIIKSQNSFAIYATLKGWTGTLSQLEAGKGYMIKTGKTQEFSYPSTTFTSNTRTKTSTVIPTTTFLLPQYSTNMNAVIEVDDLIENVQVVDKEGNIRGESTTSIVEDKNLAFLTIFAEEGENLFFLLNGEKTVDSFQFTSDALLGDLEQPYTVSNPQIDKGISVYPIPFDHQMTCSIVHSQEEKAWVEVIDMNGKSIFKNEQILQQGLNSWNLQLQVNPGVYLLHISTPTTSYTKRILK
ncbi:T9SS type A sorting domain-containing protein [Flammeovirga sp. SubArs3]|uniref:T9SS type A sorting domain-containing protein n=1 Tax=Flammeovirga sp. SubArs3 TaxID=2995316 RepID=UPI00248AF94B|nr:T9SS type A sorting domain-containing protein [Flammeovirga sp. SubArs3]